MLLQGKTPGLWQGQRLDRLLLYTDPTGYVRYTQDKDFALLTTVEFVDTL
ncbi:hypothetical protein VIBNISOn1_1330006 [Vibrio nigripulchritudo SOn1]|uniref:Uncharacterized protein n=1 Tax=Vibrio nigripulchritudo SOn1 TaxID=1238450 RepID=A0AAV2VJU1_9VIBR|nr:hypothetical protein VIBNISOn1_1330006 [Vibrio nigripulchritudo SOn1]